MGFNFKKANYLVLIVPIYNSKRSIVMKKTYQVYMSKNGSKFSSGVSLTVYADSEFEAIQEAKKRYPNLEVAEVKQK